MHNANSEGTTTPREYSIQHEVREQNTQSFGIEIILFSLNIEISVHVLQV